MKHGRLLDSLEESVSACALWTKTPSTARMNALLMFHSFAVCFRSRHMKHLLRSCIKRSKTVSGLRNQSYLGPALQYRIMLER